jgi:ribonucleoside-diphosphate reductase alpha chain
MSFGGGREGYLHVGYYDDDQPCEIFITMAKDGSTIADLMDVIATQTCSCNTVGRCSPL